MCHKRQLRFSLFFPVINDTNVATVRISAAGGTKATLCIIMKLAMRFACYMFLSTIHRLGETG
jgi:hypothetical protein